MSGESVVEEQKSLELEDVKHEFDEGSEKAEEKEKEKKEKKKEKEKEESECCEDLIKNESENGRFGKSDDWGVRLTEKINKINYLFLLFLIIFLMIPLIIYFLYFNNISIQWNHSMLISSFCLMSYAILFTVLLALIFVFLPKIGIWVVITLPS